MRTPLYEFPNTQIIDYDGKLIYSDSSFKAYDIMLMLRANDIDFNIVDCANGVRIVLLTRPIDKAYINEIIALHILASLETSFNHAVL